MSQLDQLQFARAIAHFVSAFNEHSREKWTLHKSKDGVYAKQSVMIKWRESFVNRQVHVTHNATYGVPVLWFNIYMRDGTPLTAVEALELSSNKDNFELAKNISQNEHPILGLLFYNVHPCTTMNIMKELSGEGNYIAKWLSVYGSPIGVSVPLTLFSLPPPPPSPRPLSTSEASQSSEEGEGSL